jgi:hypothetical protein
MSESWTNSDPVEDLRAVKRRLENNVGYMPTYLPVMGTKTHAHFLRWLKACGIVAHNAENFTATDVANSYWLHKTMTELYPLALGEGQAEQYDVFV